MCARFRPKNLSSKMSRGNCYRHREKDFQFGVEKVKVFPHLIYLFILKYFEDTVCTFALHCTEDGPGFNRGTGTVCMETDFQPERLLRKTQGIQLMSSSLFRMLYIEHTQKCVMRILSLCQRLRWFSVNVYFDLFF